MLYQNVQDKAGINIVPLFGTIAIFLSEELPHEVLLAIGSIIRLPAGIGSMVNLATRLIRLGKSSWLDCMV